MNENSTFKNELKLDSLEKAVIEVDSIHRSSGRNDPRVEYINPLIEEYAQDTLANVSSCVKMICKFVMPGDEDHSTLNLTADQMHGIYLFQECIDNALDFEGRRSNVYSNRKKSKRAVALFILN